MGSLGEISEITGLSSGAMLKILCHDHETGSFIQELHWHRMRLGTFGCTVRESGYANGISRHSSIASCNVGISRFQLADETFTV